MAIEASPEVSERQALGRCVVQKTRSRLLIPANENSDRLLEPVRTDSPGRGPRGGFVMSPGIAVHGSGKATSGGNNKGMRSGSTNQDLLHYAASVVENSLMLKTRLFGGLACLLLAILALATPSPTASAAGRSTVHQLDWELKFTPGPFRLYSDPSDGRLYWYFTYTVTNLTGRDLVFAPQIELFFDSGEIIKSGRGVPTKVVGQLRQLLGNPLLEDQNRIIGDLRVGPENARTGLAVWPAEDQKVNEITLFFRGLSSDRKQVSHPGDDGKTVDLYRTLRREYLVPGDATARGSTPIPLAKGKNRRGPECEFEFQIAGKPAGCWIYR